MNYKQHLPAIGVAIVITLIVTGGIGFLLTANTVPEGHDGVKTNWGATTGDTLTPGLHFMAPWQGTYDYPTRQHLYVMSATKNEGAELQDDSIQVIADDEMTVDVDAAIGFRANPERTVWLYDNIGKFPQVQDRVRSTARECIRQSGNDHEGMNLATGESRAEFKNASKICMEESENLEGVQIIEVSIRNIEPPNEVVAAINRKEAAERKVQQKRAEVEAEKQEAERKRVEAEGIRDAQETIDESLTEEYLTWYWVDNLDKHDSVYYVPVGENGQPVLTKEVDENATGGGN